MSSADVPYDEPYFEPSPFTEEDFVMTEEEKAARAARRPGMPYQPYTREELERALKREPHTRMIDPYRCTFNLAAEDGIGHGYSPTTYAKYPYRQCKTRIVDPMRARYCYEHAQQLGVAYYTPEESAAVVQAESTANLLRLVPKAVRTLETIMEDEDAPHGVRAKSAEAVLDRTGYGKGLDIHIDATVEVKDPMATLRERLTALREGQMEVASRIAQEALEMGREDEENDIHEAVVLEDAEPPDPDPDLQPPAA